MQKLSGADRDKFAGIPTGFNYLDNILTGLGRSDLIILAARPGMGKTSFALNIATNVARLQKIPTRHFQLGNDLRTADRPHPFQHRRH